MRSNEPLSEAEFERICNEPARGEPARSAGLTYLEEVTFSETYHAVTYYQEKHGMTVEQVLKWLYNNNDKHKRAFKGKRGLKKFKNTYYSSKEKLDKYFAEHPELNKKPGESGEKLK